MVAKELPHLEPFEEENTELQDPYEAEETLSLCDLPINSSAADDWDEYRRISNSDQDLFEFFSEDFTDSGNFPAAENIIFCGKLIPYKEPLLPAKVNTIESNVTKQSSKKKCLFRWKSDSYTKSKKPNTFQPKKSRTFPGNATRKCNDKYDFSLGKVSVLSPPVKSRWYLFMFGIAKFPTEMELRDIKTRQSRRSPPVMFASSNNNSNEKVMKSSQSRGKGLWGLLRTLGCKSFHANAVVKATFGCTPQMRD